MVPRLRMLLALACLTASSANAGAIDGQLWMPAASAKIAATRAASAGSVARRSVDAFTEAQRGVSDAVVYVETIPEEVTNRLEGPRGLRRLFGWLPFVSTEIEPRYSHVVQRNESFAPRVLVTRVGDGVELSNVDRVYHNAFSVSPARKFDLGKYAPGWKDTLYFNRSGVINVHCDIHPKEVGYVVVVPNLAFAQPDSLGRFELPALPPGSYRLRYWHAAHGERRMGFVVPKRGRLALELGF